MLPEEKLYVHIDHFNCSSCNKNIAEEGYYNENSKFYCEACYDEFLSPNCYYCQSLITGEHLLVMNKKYHIDCLKCNHCNNLINNKSFKMFGKLYCDNCIEIAKTFCIKCKKPTNSSNCIMSSHASRYHKECFICKKCENKIESEFVTYEENPYHLQCYKSFKLVKCNQCGNGIEETYVEILNKAVHKHCLEDFKKRIGLNNN
jgi:hypothetical protein